MGVRDVLHYLKVRGEISRPILIRHFGISSRAAANNMRKIEIQFANFIRVEQRYVTIGDREFLTKFIVWRKQE